MTERQVPALVWALMGLLALIWGGSFPANRLALAEMGVLTTVAIRICLGATVMWSLVALRGAPLPRRPGVWGRIAVTGLLNTALPFSLIVWGQTRIDSGLAAILNASTAIFGVLVAALVFRDERLGARRGTGVALGFLGVATVIGPARLAAFDPTSAGQLAVLAAAMCYAVAGSIGRGISRSTAPEVAAAGTLTAAAAVVLPLALIVEGLPARLPAPSVLGALGYLGLVATGAAYLVFFRILRLAGAGTTSLVTLMVAPVGILLGALIFGETLPLRAYGGFALLAAGLIVIDGRFLPRLYRPLPPRPRI
ncbi:DMT family transporter [Frigidibacter oleivorans]|uniref:DMT family transporter n=1 Tax=Frigidibacter oleivorans TaxID=2487129 RepID=UPI001F17E7E9|nr:DMT family transporter [Frigidibacter oleivorans]